MCQVFIYVLLVAHALGLGFVTGYKTFSMEDLGSCEKHPVEINIGTMSNSSGILVPFTGKPGSGVHCVVFLKPPLSYGVVVSIRLLDIQPFSSNSSACQNYLEISTLRRSHSERLCGYSNDEFEFKSYTDWGGTKVVFHSSNSSDVRGANFQLTFTAVRKGMNWCFREEMRCRNHHCIWKGLACDGHNNCGDLSDELDKSRSRCGVMSPGESLAIILVTIIGSLILLFIAAYLRGPKITREIERLSQCRRSNCIPTSSTQLLTEENDTTVSTVINSRTSYDDTTGLLTPYSFSEVTLPDPPPRYEEVASLPATSVSQGEEVSNLRVTPVVPFPNHI